MLANQKFKASKSDELRMNAFKKEFSQRLSMILQQEDVNPREQVLDFNLSAAQMHEMGFLQPKVNKEQEQLVDDIYTVFKCSKNQNILAENLQNLLMIISGERDQATEVQNNENNKKWRQSGVYDEATGLFYIREGEHDPIQKHFKELRNNRLQQKKPIKNYAYKTAEEQPTFKPQISKKTQQISEQRRSKLFQEKNVDVVSILLHPNNATGNVHKLHYLQKEKEERELRELTLRPQTNQYYVNNQENEPIYESRAQRLYNMSKVHLKQNKTSEEYEFEKNAEELTFTPQTNPYKG